MKKFKILCFDQQLNFIKKYFVNIAINWLILVNFGWKSNHQKEKYLKIAQFLNNINPKYNKKREEK